MCSKLKEMMHEVLPHIWWKYKIKLVPQTLLVHDTLEGLRRAVFVETFLAEYELELYLRKHFRRIDDQRSFCCYTVFACLLEFASIQNQFDRYIRVLARAACIALHCNAKRRSYALSVLPHILEKFIDVMMSDLTVNEDFLTKLGNHIIRKGYLQHNLEVERLIGEGSSRQVIHQTIAKESTIAEMERSRIEIASVDSYYIEDHHLTLKITSSLNKEYTEPKDRGRSLKMSIDQKLKVASDVMDGIKTVSLTLNGLDRYMKRAKENLKHELNFRGGVLEAPLMESVPEVLIKECLLGEKDYL